MKIIIYSFEEEFAVAELPDGKKVTCPRELFPRNAHEGSIIEIAVDETETDKRKKEMKAKMNRLFKD